MNRIRALFAALAIAAVGALVAAPAAQAQTAPVIEYKTEGGHVIFNIGMRIYGNGFTVAQETGVRQGQGSLLMYDYLTARRLSALRAAFDAARFSRLPPVLRTEHRIADLPDRVVTYRGKTVRYTSALSNPRAPIAGPAFVSLLTKLFDNFQRIADEPLVAHEQTGGIAGFHDSFVLTRSGLMTFSRNSQAPMVRQASFADVNELKRRIIAADWWNLPARFTSPVPIADGFGIGVTVYDPRDQRKTVETETGAREPRSFSAVLEQIGKLIRQVNP